MSDYMDDELLLNARKPEGKLGDELIDLMNENHEGLAVWSLNYLDISQNDDVLDIGCGGGANVARFLKMTEGRVAGLDYSALSVERSIELNRTSIDSGRCSIVHGSVCELPFEDDSFDIATAFETVYFWPDLVNDLKEVHRVLKDDGIIFIANEALPAEDDQRQKHVAELLDMKIYSQAELEQSLHQAGFGNVDVHVRRSNDSFTGDEADWICISGKKTDLKREAPFLLTYSVNQNFF